MDPGNYENRDGRNIIHNRLTPEEEKIIKELGRQTLYKRTFPLSLLTVGLYVAYAKRHGVKPGFVRPLGLVILCHITSTAARMRENQEELVRRCPDGFFAQLKKRRELILQPKEEGPYQRRLPEQYKPDRPVSVQPIRKTDDDVGRNYDSMGLDDYNRPTVDKGGPEDSQRSSLDFIGPDETRSSKTDDAYVSEPKSYVTYEDLRRRNRGLDQPRSPSQSPLPVFERNPPPSQGSRRDDFQQPYVPSGKRNKYGDLIE